MNPAAQREAQATACLEAAERYQAPLVALATGLTGSKAEGMELFQQAVLNCHDAIQAGGFQGDHYQFYLRRAIKNLHYRTQQQARRFVPLVSSEPTLFDEEMPGEWGPSPARGTHALAHAGPEPKLDEQAVLVEQIEQELRERFTMADRVALHLHVVDGKSCQQIADLIGTKDQSWVWRRLQRVKEHLRAAFQQSWASLGE